MPPPASSTKARPTFRTKTAGGRSERYKPDILHRPNHDPYAHEVGPGVRNQARPAPSTAGPVESRST
jgi:hypothetical protein